MRRVIPVIVATAGGLALLASFHTSPGGVSLATGGVVPSTAVPSTDTSSPPASGGPGPAGSAPPTTVGDRRTIDGPIVPTDYGDVQVRVVLVGRQIVDVQALQLPYDRARSVRISHEAAPLLREEALRAQSARIDLVSGASYTSEGYAESLQGALDQASR